MQEPKEYHSLEVTELGIKINLYGVRNGTYYIILSREDMGKIAVDLLKLIPHP